jgi:hypothetical protein
MSKSKGTEVIGASAFSSGKIAPKGDLYGSTLTGAMLSLKSFWRSSLFKSFSKSASSLLKS